MPGKGVSFVNFVKNLPRWANQEPVVSGDHKHDVGDSYRLRRAGTPVSFLFFLLLHPLLYCGDPAFLFIIPLFYYLSRLSPL